MVKNLPDDAGDAEKRVLTLCWERPLEEEMATHSSILAWKIPWTEEPGSLQSMGLQRVRHDRVTNTFTVRVLKSNKRCGAAKTDKQTNK